MTTKPATAQAVSRALTAAGFTRSESWLTNAVGTRGYGRGFTASGSGTVTVEFRPWQVWREDAPAAVSTLGCYAEVLSARGFTAEIVAPNGETDEYRVLHVTREG